MVMRRHIDLMVSPDLYDIVAQEADRRNISMGQVVVEALARQLEKPELGFIPRKRPGRPRKEPAGV
jgi:hypothetical protein